MFDICNSHDRGNISTLVMRIMRKLIIFIHGLGGSRKGTWQKFPQLIEAEEELKEFDIDFFGFPSALLGLRYWFGKHPSIQEVARGLKSFIDNRCCRYDEIVLICHSLGGLIGKQYIIDCLKYKYELKVNKILLYATPSIGSNWANIGTVFFNPLLRQQNRQLCVNSEFSQNLNTEWNHFDTSNIQIKYVIAGKDMWVNYISGTSGGEYSETVVDEGHLSLVKPKANNDLSFLICKNFLLATKENPPKRKYEEVDSYMSRGLLSAQEENQHSFLILKTKTSIETLEGNKHIVILANAGEGKTEELRHIAHYYSRDEAQLHPFLVNLNQYIGGDISQILPSEHCDVPEAQRIYIFDGLDEVEPLHHHDARKEIMRLREEYPDAYIVTSCRRNYFNVSSEDTTGSLKGFAEFSLAELHYDEYSKYVEKRLGKEDKKAFFELTWQNGLNSYLPIPFYFVNLVDMYEENKTLPDNKADLLNSFIDQRLKLDINHFDDKRRDDLLENKKQIMLALQKLALAMETMGRNFINSDDLPRFIENKDIRELLKSGTLMKIENKGIDSKTYQFEHNNFQEYLAAKILSKASLESIKSFIYNEKFNKIIPQWSNTVHFLITLRQENDLFDWLLETEPDMLVSSEADRLSEQQRITIFKRIFNKYVGMQIWVDTRTHFDHEELAIFGQSEEIIEFLLSKISQNSNDIAYIESIIFLGEMKIPPKYKDTVISILKDNAIRTDKGELAQGRSLDALRGHSEWLTDKPLIDEIVSKVIKSDSQRVKGSLWHLLNETAFVNDYIDYYLEAIKKYIEQYHSVSREVTLQGESFNLFKGIKSTTGEAFKKVLIFIGENYSNYIDLDAMEDGKDVILKEKAVDEYRKDESIFELMFNLFLNNNATPGLFSYFFSETGTTQKAIDLLLRNEENPCYYISAIIDTASADRICFEYDKGVHDDVFIHNLLAFTKNFNATYEYLYNKINKETNNRFLIEEFDYDGIEKLRTQRYFDLLFCKDDFLDEVRNIFETQSKNELTNDELRIIEHPKNSKFPRQILLEIRRIALKNGDDAGNEKIVSLDEAVEHYTSGDWRAKSFSWIYDFIRRHSDSITITGIQTEYIQNLYNHFVTEINFRKALLVDIDSEGRCSYRYLPLAEKLHYFLNKFHFDTHKNTLYDLLHYDCSGSSSRWHGIEYLEYFLNQEELTNEIIANLAKGDLNPVAFKNHIDYCCKHNLQVAAPYAKELMLKDGAYDEARSACLEYIFKVLQNAGGIKILEDSLLVIKDKFIWEVVDKLIPFESIKCKDYLETLINETSDEDEKYLIVLKALKMKSLLALDCFVNAIQSKGTLPRNNSHIEPQLIMDSLAEALPRYISLLKISYTSTVKDEIGLSRLRRIITDTLQKCALRSEADYFMIVENVKQCIEQNKDIDNIYSINYFLEELEKLYFLNNSRQLSCQEVELKIKQVFGV